MIYLLNFNHHITEYKYAVNSTTNILKTIYDILDDSIILHRYKLAFLGFRKFQISDPNKIKFDKIDSKNIILYHLDIYSKDTESIRLLLDFCKNNDKDIYIPVSDGIRFHFKSYYEDEFPHRYSIKKIIEDEYEYIKYEFTGSDVINSQIDLMKRDLRLRNLLD
jgi:hypothetical protein